MNTKSLARHYPALSAAERLSLMLAAATRGDEVEHARLTDAAPRETWRVPHTFGRALAFFTVAMLQRAEALELAALFFKTAALADTTTGKLAARCRNTARLFGYLVNVQADGWAQFCAEEQLDPAACAPGMSGGTVLEQAAKEAETLAFTEAEARQHARDEKRDPDNVRTAESVAVEWQALFRQFVEQWG